MAVRGRRCHLARSAAARSARSARTDPSAQSLLRLSGGSNFSSSSELPAFFRCRESRAMSRLVLRIHAVGASPVSGLLLSLLLLLLSAQDVAKCIQGLFAPPLLLLPSATLRMRLGSLKRYPLPLHHLPRETQNTVSSLPLSGGAASVTARVGPAVNVTRRSLVKPLSVNAWSASPASSMSKSSPSASRGAPSPLACCFLPNLL